MLSALYGTSRFYVNEIIHFYAAHRFMKKLEICRMRIAAEKFEDLEVCLLFRLDSDVGSRY